jgi:hypothetical protein
MLALPANSLVEISYVNIVKTNKATRKQRFSLINDWETGNLITGVLASWFWKCYSSQRVLCMNITKTRKLVFNT